MEHLENIFCFAFAAWLTEESMGSGVLVKLRAAFTNIVALAIFVNSLEGLVTCSVALTTWLTGLLRDERCFV